MYLCTLIMFNIDLSTINILTSELEDPNSKFHQFVCISVGNHTYSFMHARQVFTCEVHPHIIFLNHSTNIGRCFINCILHLNAMAWSRKANDLKW